MTDVNERADAARWHAVRGLLQVEWHEDGHICIGGALCDPNELPADEVAALRRGYPLQNTERVEALIDDLFRLTPEPEPAAPPALPEGWTACDGSPHSLYDDNSRASAIAYTSGLVGLRDNTGERVVFRLTALAQIVDYLQDRQRQDPFPRGSIAPDPHQNPPNRPVLVLELVRHKRASRVRVAPTPETR